VETIGSKRSYALTRCMPNNDDDDDDLQVHVLVESVHKGLVSKLQAFIMWSQFFETVYIIVRFIWS